MDDSAKEQFASLLLLISTLRPQLISSITEVQKPGRKMTFQEAKLRAMYGGKVAEWKRKSLMGYAKSLDKKWDNWFESMSK